MKRRYLRTMDDIPLDEKKVLVRVDFNVSIGNDGKVDETEDYRIEAAIPTIEELMKKKCKILLLTHRGRKGDHHDKMDLKPVRLRLEKLLQAPVKSVDSLEEKEVTSVVDGMEPGSVVMLGNVRSDQREIEINDKFAEQLASLADVYIGECFSVMHRAHTSVAAVPFKLASAIGRHSELEIGVLEKLKENPERPYVAIVSGAKIHTKMGMFHSLLKQVDTLCVGGQIANVLLAARYGLDAKGVDPDEVVAAKHILDEAGAEKIILPADVVVGEDDGSKRREMSVGDFRDDVHKVWDIGLLTVWSFIDACEPAKTVLWNGPLGKVEVEEYRLGTEKMASELAKLSNYRVVGGGDTVNVLEDLALRRKFDHVSVGGGALVAFLEGERMPGLEPLYAEN